MDTVKKMTKISLIYLIGQLGSKFINVIMLPVYTNYISPGDYGTFDVITAYMSVIVPVLCLEVWSGMLRFALVSKDEEYKRKVVNNSLIICFAGIAVITAGMLIVNAAVSLENLGFILLYTVTLILMYITTMSCRAYGQNKLYAATGMVSVFVNALVSIVCIFTFHLGLETLFIAAIASNIAQIVLIECKLHIFSKFRIRTLDKEILRVLFKFCLPLSINSVTSFLLSNVNRIIISTQMADAETANGINAVANKLTVFITLLVSVFYMAWQETNYQEKDHAVRARNCRLGYTAFLKLVGAGVVLLLPVTKIFFPILIGNEYQDAFPLIPFFYLATYFQSINGFTATFFSIENKNDKLVLSKIAGCVVNVTVILVLIGQYGLVSSPIALIASQLLITVVQYLQYRKFIEVDFQFKKMLFVVVFFIASSAVYYLGNIWINIGWLILSGVVFLFFCKDILLSLLRRFPIPFLKRRQK